MSIHSVKPAANLVVVPDSGASAHIFDNKNHFDIYSHSKILNVETANGEPMIIMGTGSINPFQTT